MARLHAVGRFFHSENMVIRLRDDFTQRTIADTAKAVGYRCSNPDCQRLTVGSNAEHDGVINLGVAAHITAASPGGPRYDDTADAETRKGKDNCVWLCQDCAKLIDSNAPHFTVELLQDWKRDAEEANLSGACRAAAETGRCGSSSKGNRGGRLATRRAAPPAMAAAEFEKTTPSRFSRPRRLQANGGIARLCRRPKFADSRR